MGIFSLVFLGAIFAFLVFCFLGDYWWGRDPRSIDKGFAAYIIAWVAAVGLLPLLSSDIHPAAVGGIAFLLLLAKGAMEVVTPE